MTKDRQRQMTQMASRWSSQAGLGDSSPQFEAKGYLAVQAVLKLYEREDRTLKRKAQNRESARRARLRKMELIQELNSQASHSSSPAGAGQLGP